MLLLLLLFVCLFVCLFIYFVMKERLTVSKLHNEFNEADPADVKGRYGHKMYGYLIPPEPGTV